MFSVFGSSSWKIKSNSYVNIISKRVRFWKSVSINKSLNSSISSIFSQITFPRLRSYSLSSEHSPLNLILSLPILFKSSELNARTMRVFELAEILLSSNFSETKCSNNSIKFPSYSLVQRVIWVRSKVFKINKVFDPSSKDSMIFSTTLSFSKILRGKALIKSAS